MRFEPLMKVKKGECVAAHVIAGGRHMTFTALLPFGGFLGLWTAPGPKDWSPRKGQPRNFHVVGEISAHGLIVTLRVSDGRGFREYGPLPGPGVLGVERGRSA